MGKIRMRKWLKRMGSGSRGGSSSRNLTPIETSGGDDIDQTLVTPRSRNISLGSGSFSPDGKAVINFIPSPSSLRRAETLSSSSSEIIKRVSSEQTFTTKSSYSVGSSNTLSGIAAKQLFTSSDSSSSPEKSREGGGGARFLRKKSSFLRVADLDMETATSFSEHNTEPDEAHPNYHHPATDPPPGVDHDPKEFWIALDDGSTGSHAPIAPHAIERLADFGLVTCLNDAMWTPDSNTTKLLKSGGLDGQQQWMQDTFKPGKTCCGGNSVDDKGVLIWTGNFKHGFYGSELPTVRAAGLVNMSAKALMELMVDSTRVKEYNKFSLGRQDLCVFQDNINADGPFGRSITKVMKSETRPPMVRKNIAFVSILHAKELPDGSGYLIVSRAVHTPEEDSESPSLANAMKSEILMGVNVIRAVKGEENDRCLMINVNHIRSPMIPMMLAKRIGLSAAVNFLNDIRAVNA